MKKRFTPLFYSFMTLIVITLVSSPALAAGGEGHGFHAVYFAGVVLNFIIFCWLLVKFAKPALNKHYATQREELVNHLDAAKKLREKAEQKLQEYQTKLDGLEEERKEILDKYHVQGEKERDRLIANAKQQIEKMKQNATLVIKQEQRRAVKELEQEAVNLAVKLAEKKLREQVTEETDKRMIQELSKALSQRKAA